MIEALTAFLVAGIVIPLAAVRGFDLVQALTRA